MAHRLRPFDPGRTRDGSTAFEPEVVSASTTLMSLRNDWEAAQALLELSNPSSTPAFHPPSNGVIYNARSTSSGKRTRDTESSRTSPRASTSRDPACVPFWTPFTKEWSQRLWSCTATALQDSPVTYWSSFSNKKDAGSWYTVGAKAPSQPSNSPRTLWQSQRSLWRLITDAEQRKTDANASAEQAKKKRKQARSKAKKSYELPRAQKIRVYPTKAERDTLKKWFGLTRRAYNIAVDVTQKLEQGDAEMTERVRALAQQVKMGKKNGGRPLVKAKDGRIFHVTRGWADAAKLVVRQIEREEEWVEDCPQAVRDSGVRDFEKAKRSGTARNEERRQQGEEEARESFKFRSRKDATQTLEINARDWKTTSKQGGLFLRMRRHKERLPSSAECAVRVQMDKLGRVSLCFVREVKARGENQAPNRDGAFHSTAVLDPGVRTFQAIFDADGQGIEWGKADMATIFRLCRAADGIQTKISKKRATWALRRAYHRTLRRIKDKIKECHRKLALFLCENFRVIMIPKFEVSRMVKRRNRKLNSKTVRQMCCWSHFAFREALKAKAELFPWVKVVEVDEAYTSKTCEECGHLHEKLGGNKTFKCPKCQHVADRDLHASSA